MRQYLLSLVFLISTTALAVAFDTTSPPNGVWSDDQYKIFWNSHKNSKECLTDVFDASPERVIKPSISPISDSDLANKKWNDIFPVVVGLENTRTELSYIKQPKPIKKLIVPNSLTRYGDRNKDVDYSLNWFMQNSTLARFEGNSGKTSQILKNTLIDWAKADALKGGLGDPVMPYSIEYTASVLILGIINSVSIISPIISSDEKLILAKWLNRLMTDVSNARFGSPNKITRVQNAGYRQAEMLLRWALIIDDEVLIQKIIDTYKTAIHDMRPDGTFTLDSNRGGMGLQYQSVATSHLVMIASLLKLRKDINLFDYEVNGRNLEKSIDFVIKSIDNPGKMNAIYASPCPNAGDRWGTIKSPSMGYRYQLNYLVVYAYFAPKSNLKSEIIKRYGYLMNSRANLAEIDGGTSIGLFGINNSNDLNDKTSLEKNTCMFALTGDKQSFTKVYSFKKYVQHAEQLGLTPEKCQAILVNQE